MGGTRELADKMLSGEILNEQRYGLAMHLYLECLQVKDLSKLNVVNPSLTLEEY